MFLTINTSGSKKVSIFIKNNFAIHPTTKVRGLSCKLIVNEAPEKIYIDSFSCFAIESNGKDVEYTRTDTIIEKVLDYIENNIYDHYDGDNEYGICGGYVKKEEFIKNLKDYIKGR